MAISFLTFNDAINHLRDAQFGIAQDRELAILKRAARGAYRDLIDSHRWRYGLVEYGRRLVAPYSTGTITYDHTGGVYERMVTLASGTWPDEAAHYKLLIGSEVYVVDERKTPSILTLDATLNPGLDVAAGTAYTLYRDSYPLPDDFLKLDDVLNNGNAWFNSYVEPNEYLALERQRRYITSTPFCWTIMSDPQRPGGWSLRVCGYPQTAANLVFMYQRGFKEPVLSGLETNSHSSTSAILASVRIDSKTITGTGTTFSEKMVNAVIRIGEDATNLPTDNNGLYPFAQELRIRSVETATSMTAYTPATASANGRKFVVSDLLDLDRTMLEAYLRGAEWKLAVISGKNIGENGRTNKDYYSALRLAMQQDNKLLIPSVAGGPGGGMNPIDWTMAYGTVESG